MNKIKSSNPSSQLIFALVVFMAVMILGFIFQDVLKETVLVYIQYALWVGELTIKGFDQRCIWMMTLVITLFLTLKFSRHKRMEPIDEPTEIPEERSPETRRIHFWRQRVRVMRTTVERDYYLSELIWLVVKTLMYHEKKNLDEIKECIRSGELLVPSEVHDLLGLNELQNESNQRVGITDRIRRWFQSLREGSKATTYLSEPNLEKVAAYLESLLEAEHDF